MYGSVYDLKAFYNSREGRVIRRLIQTRIAEFWPDAKNLNLMGSGYATPFMRKLGEGAQRLQIVMPASKGAHHWPPEGRNLVCMSHSTSLPIESNSIDRVLMVHDLEFAEYPQEKLQEVWRVLKSNGRWLLIVPNRAGFWARTDWSPFGHGAPYSLGQLHAFLRENLFVQERSQEALFMPPIKAGFILKSAGAFERLGQILPIGAGVHMVEASKQLYARATPSSGSKVLSGARLIPKPAVSPYQLK